MPAPCLARMLTRHSTGRPSFTLTIVAIAPKAARLLQSFQQGYPAKPSRYRASSNAIDPASGCSRPALNSSFGLDAGAFFETCYPPLEDT